MGKVSRKAVDSNTALVLVERKGDEPRVDSRILAEKLGGEHQSSLVLIDRYLTDFEEFGVCAPTVDKPRAGSSGGRPGRYYLLNEGQAHVLLTYSKNTPEARKLKKELIRLFLDYRARLNRIARQRIDPTWLEIRNMGKDTRKHLSRQIARVVEIAKAEGSENGPHLFENFSKLTNKKLGIEKPARGATRDALDADTLALVEQVELVQSGAIVKALSAGVPRKEIYPVVKAEIEALNVVALRPVEKPKELPAPDPRLGLFDGLAEA